MKRHYLILTLLVIEISTSAQTPTRTIRGTVLEKETQSPLPDTTVVVLSDTIQWGGAMTDVEGNFKIEKVPIELNFAKNPILLTRVALNAIIFSLSGGSPGCEVCQPGYI